MPRCLTVSTITQYRTRGYLAPIDVLSVEEIAAYQNHLHRVEAGLAGRLPPMRNVKPHLLLPWLWDLVHDPRILDPVEDILGPDILCWASGFFDKRPGEPHHVPWHQDATYWGLERPEALTAWVAFTPSHPANGGLRVIPGTHGAALAHGDTGDRTNMLPGREQVIADVNESDAVDIVLTPGQMSLHHLLLIHGSRPNESQERRCGLAIRYIAGDLARADGNRGTATLVRGRDHGHFDLEQQPDGEFDPAALGRYNAILRRWMRGVFDEVARHQGRL
ncbi:MAG: phytanoyl-CoA dioxygenase family protein [Acetobacteraceae bacterium]